MPLPVPVTPPWWADGSEKLSDPQPHSSPQMSPPHTHKGPQPGRCSSGNYAAHLIIMHWFCLASSILAKARFAIAKRCLERWGRGAAVASSVLPNLPEGMWGGIFVQPRLLHPHPWGNNPLLPPVPHDLSHSSPSPAKLWSGSGKVLG